MVELSLLRGLKCSGGVHDNFQPSKHHRHQPCYSAIGKQQNMQQQGKRKNTFASNNGISIEAHPSLCRGFSSLQASLELVILIFLHPPQRPQSLKVTRISQLVLSKMTSLLPYLGTKYFPLLLLLQSSSDFPHHHQRHAFISTFPESWAGGRKALSSPSSLIEIQVWPLIPSVLV